MSNYHPEVNTEGLVACHIYVGQPNPSSNSGWTTVGS